MTGILGWFLGTSTLCTGVEDDPSGALRVYVGPRYQGIYALIEDAEDKEKMRVAWEAGGHVLIPTPPADALYQEER